MNIKNAYQLSQSAQIEFASKLLDQGEVIGLPTETVYGLAARIDLSSAVEKIFSTKRRPFFDPLIVHVHSVEQAITLFASWSPLVNCLAHAFWPGPLTLVSEKQKSVSDLITSGLQTVGVRLPQHSLALELLRHVGVPLAAPSANLFGQISPTSAQNVKDVFQDQVFVLDGGDCQVGIESTIVHVDGQRLSILRPGVLSSARIEACLKSANLHFELSAPQAAIAPGQMKHHYMPHVPLILSSNPELKPSEIASQVMMQLSDIPDEVDHVRLVKPTKVEKIEFLTLSEDSLIAARQLYANLRAAANKQPDIICFVVQPIHLQPEWLGVLDRLKKASSLSL